MSKRKLIGEVGVDSGQLMICDPCYIESEWDRKEADFTEEHHGKKPTGKFSYVGACLATCAKESAGQLNFKMGHAGAGVAFSSGYGDGCYPVYATYNDEGRVIKVEVIMG